MIVYWLFQHKLIMKAIFSRAYIDWACKIRHLIFELVPSNIYDYSITRF